MKKTLFLATVILLLGSIIALFVRSAGPVSFNPQNVFMAIGGVAACGLVLMAFGDYARKPRFAVRSAYKTKTAMPAKTSEVDGACDWTYATRSA